MSGNNSLCHLFWANPLHPAVLCHKLDNLPWRCVWGLQISFSIQKCTLIHDEYTPSPVLSYDMGMEYDHAYLSCHFCPITINLFKIRHCCIISYCRYWWCLWVSKKETILCLFVKYGWGAQGIHRAFGCTVCIWRPHCNKNITIWLPI